MTDPGASGGDALPRPFGRYLLIRRLTSGGMGEIFLAKVGRESGFEKPCVIKKILPHLAADPGFVRRFIDEAQVAIRLAHASIASVFEAGLFEGEYFLALEYVEGRDLRRLFARLAERGERLPPDLALWIVREVASGLAYAHRRTGEGGRPLGLVHCDISPPNILVSFEGEVKIIDFGIARSALRSVATDPHVGFGKFGYMAPEQLLRGGVVDPRTDIYSAGVLLYELLTGERLFRFPPGLEYRAMARMVAQGEHPRPSARDPRLEPYDDMVMTALATDAARRYAHAEELRDACQRALARVNPTLTADRVGTALRALFADEVSAAHRLLEEASAVDLAPFAEELTGARTVSFALRMDSGPVADLEATADRSQTVLVPRSLRPSRSRPWLLALLVTAALAVGLVLGLSLRLRPRVIAPGPRLQPVLVQPLIVVDAGPRDR